MSAGLHYQSKSRGPLLIAEMNDGHVQNALAVAERDNHDAEVIEALRARVAEIEGS